MSALTKVEQSLTSDKTAFKNAVTNMEFGGLTPTALGVRRALEAYVNAPNKIISQDDDKDRLKVFLLITDGIANIRIDGQAWFTSMEVSVTYNHILSGIYTKRGRNTNATRW